MKNIIMILVFVSIAILAKGQYSIEGYLYYNLSPELPVSDVTFQLKKISDNSFMGNNVTTNSTGYFKFDNVPDGKYIIDGTITKEPEGWNSLDALLTNKSYLGSVTFTDILKEKAADVDKSGVITPQDALLINKRYIGTVSLFLAGEWLFTQDTITVSGSNITHNLKALCFGDVNGDYDCPGAFVCGDNLVDSRDGKSYKTVLIGTQCWMKENLNVGTMINGTGEQTNNGTIEKYCYNDDLANCNVYGGLYQWDEMMQHVTTEKTQGICPTGWYIPSKSEWVILTTSLGGVSIAGGKMKEAGNSHWFVPNSGADNSSGFTALPGGVSYNATYFGSLNALCRLWSSTEFDNDVWDIALGFDYTRADISPSIKSLGFSVRCLKDCPAIEAPGSGINTPSQQQIIWNWTAVSEATGYKYNTTNDYSTATDIGTSRSYTQFGLTCNTSYTLYVWAYNNCGNTSLATLTQSTSACPCPSVYPPHNGTNTSSQDQIIWRWLAVTGAAGYKWNSTNDYANAIDNGTSTSITQSGLTCNTPYSIYVWAYNSCNEHSNPSFLMQTTSECPSTFNCGDNLVDTRDSKSYKTVKIGTQCWMKENINIGTRVNASAEQADNATFEKYCYDDDEANCSVYGGLYQWNEAMQYVTTEPIKGICPTGWHIPSEGDWGVLITLAGGNGVAGGKLKETGFTHWAEPNTSATDSYNFTALGAGMRVYNGTFYYLTKRTYIWSSGVRDASNAYVRGPLSDNAGVTYGAFTKADGFSVRCIKD